MTAHWIRDVAKTALGRRVGRRAALALAGPLPLLPSFTYAQAVADPLPSWRDSAAKRTVLDFVAAVTTEGGPDFVPFPERIAVFDNDGTLWVEQPIYTQLLFILDRIRALAPQNPAWRRTALSGPPRRRSPCRGRRRRGRSCSGSLAPRKRATPGGVRRIAIGWLTAARDRD